MDKKNRYCKRYTSWLAHATTWYNSGWYKDKEGYDVKDDYRTTIFPDQDRAIVVKQARTTNPNSPDKNPGSVVEIRKPSDVPSSWDKNSPAFKQWKKEYNAWYYQNHPEKWNLDKSPMSSTATGYKDAAYKQAAEARAKANADRANRVGVSNAKRMLYRSARGTDPERTTFGKELFNAKSRLNDMWAEGAGSIASAGKSVINKAKANRSSFNDMWTNGASTIAKAGKSFLKNWLDGIGK